MKKKALLIEPNYSNKFPPVGLMKIATYFRNLGNWEVVFFKGDLKAFVLERIVDKLVNTLDKFDNSEIDWFSYKDVLFDYIKLRKKSILDQLPIDKNEINPFLLGYIEEAKEYYIKGMWEQHPEWDWVGVTTLFTFYWDITIDTINFAKKLVKDEKNLMVGGVLASIQPDEIEKATGIRPHVGILGPGDIHKDDKQNIDELELDYSILDEIEYQYPMANSFYRYTTRGCVRKCPFCAVPILEPKYQSYIPLKERIDSIRAKYGDQKDLLLMDNNVLASKDFEKIINEIVECGFGKGAIFKEENPLTISFRNLTNGVNDRAYIRKTWKILDDFYFSLKGDDSYSVYLIREKYHIGKLITTTKKNLIKACNELMDLYNKYFKPSKGKLRIVDFNQGVDARLFTKEKVKLLSKIAIRPLRIAFDDIKTEPQYVEAVKMSVKAGLKSFSNYLLYNFNDHPDELYMRLKINVELGEELGVSIYSFPMKYHPIRKTNDMTEDFSHNRDYIGKYWNRKYIRAIQAILNSTKGKIGRGKSFFEKAFGRDIEEYRKLLVMPEDMIIYRFFFDWLSLPKAKKIAKALFNDTSICNYSTEKWWKIYCKCKKELPKEDWENLQKVIFQNDYNSINLENYSSLAKELLGFYIEHRKSKMEKGTDLYKMKVEYEKDPIQRAKRKHIYGREEE